MLTLLSSLFGFLAGGLPKVLGFFQDRADKKHEMAMAQLQTERELELRKAGFEVMQRVEEIKVEGQMVEAASAERNALYAHDIAIGQGASQWVINLRAGVRPNITYGMFLLLVFVEVAGFSYAWRHAVDFEIMLNNLWDDETQTIWTLIISFWFGSQAFSKK
jgi:hypothetical protein